MSISLCSTLMCAAGVDYTKNVNVIIGTNGMGHTFPGACAPFGAVQLSPDTDNTPHNINGTYQKDVYQYCAGYQYKDSTIVGFSHTHLSGTGHSDLGDILVMPIVGEVKFTAGTAQNPDEGYRSRFSHDTEVASPGYYEVMLDDYGVKAQLTATKRVGVHKYSFENPNDAHLLIDMQHGIYNYNGKTLWSYIRVESPTLITGYTITNGWAQTKYTYFAMQLSEPITNYGYRDNEKVNYNGGHRKFNPTSNFPEMGGRKLVAFFDFDLSKTKQLEVKVALSAVSTEGAIKNLKAETEGKSFDDILSQTRKEWNEKLSIIEAEGSADQIAMLYTSLYHTMINPSVYMDVDGQYRGIDHNIHKAQGFDNYTVFSLWDTYRALHPLLNIINPQHNTHMVNSMLAHYEQSVHKVLPVWSLMGNENWCMMGYHGVSVLSDAIAKGIKIDLKKALRAMHSSATLPYYTGMADYMQLGYVPFDDLGHSVSVTLEYAYDDWCIYQAALKDGNSILAEKYRQRALNYKNVFNPRTGFSHPRLRDGSWKQPFDMLKTMREGYDEGNCWNYSFYVPHDVKGLIDLMGGDKKFVANLDTVFTMHIPKKYFGDSEDVSESTVMGGYVHGNEPSHHIAYLYNWSSQPWKTQYWVREIMNRMFKNNIDGLCGNDDCGQMSAWYVFTAMGFYPVCPGSDQYVFGAPYLPYMKVTLGNGKTLVIRAPKVSDKNRYVKSITFNGKEITKTYIDHSDLMQGGELVFDMQSRPNKKRGVKEGDKPYSMTK